jgi:hypothetical protein
MKTTMSEQKGVTTQKDMTIHATAKLWESGVCRRR